MLRSNSSNLRREIRDIQGRLAFLRSQAREQYARHDAVVARQAEIFRSVVRQEEVPLPEQLKELLVQIERQEEELECLEADLRMVEAEEASEAWDEEHERQYASLGSRRSARRI